ncbi:MAG: hypothetical protein WDN08_14075 [Rhizomicrobium sp.]
MACIITAGGTPRCRLGRCPTIWSDWRRDALQLYAARAFRRDPLRALVRTWAWLRFWPLLGDRLVGYVDRHFEPLVPLLAAPLFTMALLRRMAARFRWQPFAKLSTGAREHGHKAG